MIIATRRSHLPFDMILRGLHNDNCNTPNIVRPKHGRYFADDVSKGIFLNKTYCTSIKNLMMTVRNGPLDNESLLVEVIVWCRIGGNSLSKRMMNRLIKAHILQLTSLSLSKQDRCIDPCTYSTLSNQCVNQCQQLTLCWWWKRNLPFKQEQNCHNTAINACSARELVDIKETHTQWSTGNLECGEFLFPIPRGCLCNTILH